MCDKYMCLCGCPNQYVVINKIQKYMQSYVYNMKLKAVSACG